MERTSLKQIALARLHAFKLGCKIDSPKVKLSQDSNLSEADLREIETSAYGLAKFKEWLDKRGKICGYANISATEFDDLLRKLFAEVKATKQNQKHSSSDKKRRPYMLKKKALTTGMFDRKVKRNQEITSGFVFGTSLEKCLENDRQMKQKTVNQDSPRIPARSRSTTHASLLGKTLKSATSCQSLSDILAADEDGKRSLLSYGYSESNESLDLEKRSRLLRKTDSTPDLISSSCGYKQEPRVPNIVESCFRHIQQFGLNTVGIFRVSSSKRRVRQLRDDFDSGKTVILNEENQPHDVAQLLKEYFRDLREPLLTKELYSALIGTKRLKNIQDQREALHYILSLLPITNRDTLWALLNFLSDVASCAEDSRDESGELITGNKMDSHNLATLFGPNILRSHKSGPDKEYKVESVMRAEERCDVIRVTQTLIDHHSSLFMVGITIWGGMRLIDTVDTVRPLPKAKPTSQQTKGRKKRKCAILTNTPKVEAIEREQLQKSKKTAMNGGKKKTKPAESSNDEDYYLFCLKPYSNSSNSRPRETWIKCVECSGWAHSECTNADTGCVFVCLNCVSDVDDEFIY
ncbi:Rho GTPase-activating protein 6 [Nymphon striatum]|nr:Rho GTPase-activating protein 6 [Nymphon striatum]